MIAFNIFADNDRCQELQLTTLSGRILKHKAIAQVVVGKQPVSWLQSLSNRLAKICK